MRLFGLRGNCSADQVQASLSLVLLEVLECIIFVVVDVQVQNERAFIPAPRMVVAAAVT